MDTKQTKDALTRILADVDKKQEINEHNIAVFTAKREALASMRVSITDELVKLDKLEGEITKAEPLVVEGEIGRYRDLREAFVAAREVAAQSNKRTVMIRFNGVELPVHADSSFEEIEKRYETNHPGRQTESLGHP